MDIGLIEILGLTSFGVTCDDGKSGWIRLERFEINRILAVMVRQRAVHVVERDEVMVLPEVLNACVFLAIGVLGVELVAAVGLTRDVPDHVGTARGDAVAVVEVDVHFHEPVHDACPENRTIPSADIDKRRFCHFVSLTPGNLTGRMTDMRAYWRAYG